MTLTNVGTQNAIRLVRGGDGPTLIVNRDLVNSILIGSDSAVSTIGSTSVSIIDPLGSMSVGGNQDIWAVAATGTATVDTQTDAAYWSPSPTQIAEQITLGGVFLLSGAQLISSAPLGTITPGNTFTTGVLNISQIGYEFILDLVWSGAPTDGMAVTAEIVWIDSKSGTVVFVDRYYPGAGAANINFHLKSFATGPTKGDQFQLTIVNNDNVGNLGGSYTLLQNSRQYQRDRFTWRDIGFSIPNPFTAFPPFADQFSGLLAAIDGVLVVAGGSKSYLCPPFNGPVFYSHNAAGPTAAQFTANFAYASARIFGGHTFASIAGLNIQQQLALPRAPVTLTLTNTGTVNASFQATLVAQE